MTLWLLVDSALRSLALGAAVWLGLKALRVRNPELELTAWTVVLAAALAMPLLAGIVTVTLPARLPVPAPDASLAMPAASLETPPLPALPAIPDVAPAAPHGAVTTPIDWRPLATGLYLLIAGLLLVRTAVGVAMTWRMARGAAPIRASWTGKSDIRVCGAIAIPVTFGRTILLPAGWTRWSAAKRRAVLAHERSHVARADYPVLLLAALHRALFWFNPLSWWLLNRLATLMEAASDDAAIADLRDRYSYAEILLDIAASGGRTPAGVAMARPATVAARIARILRESGLPARPGWRKRLLASACLLPVAVGAAGTIVQPTPAEYQPLAEAVSPLRLAELAPVPLDGPDLNLLAPSRLQVQPLPVSLHVPAAFPAIRPIAMRTVQLAPLDDVKLPPSAAAPSLDSAGAGGERGAEPADMSGTWNIFGLPPPERTWSQDVGPFLRPTSCTFVQADDKLTGTCKNLFLETPIKGSVNGRTVHFDWFYWLGSGRLTDPRHHLRRASFDGALGADKVLRGTYKNMFAYLPQPGIYPGTFRAEKQPSNPS
jgi:hypothetical protein